MIVKARAGRGLFVPAVLSAAKQLAPERRGVVEIAFTLQMSDWENPADRAGCCLCVAAPTRCPASPPQYPP